MNLKTRHLVRGSLLAAKVVETESAGVSLSEEHDESPSTVWAVRAALIRLITAVEDFRDMLTDSDCFDLSQGHAQVKVQVVILEV